MFEMIAQAGDVADPSKLPPSNDEIAITAVDATIKRYDCGHDGPSQYSLNVYGDGAMISGEKTPLCPECIIADVKKMVIRCCSCGLPIFPGNTVALYSFHRSFKHRKIAKTIDGALIGCMRWDCCPSGGFMAGHWTKDGYKSLFNEDGTSDYVQSCPMPDRPTDLEPNPIKVGLWYKIQDWWYGFLNRWF